MMKTKLIIFEDNENLRNSLVVLLNSSEEFEIVGDFPNVLEAGNQVRDLIPEVVILDIDMPGKDGISVIPEIKGSNPDISIVMYTQFEDEDKISRSLCAGADGYVLKKTSPMLLFQAIEEVKSGGPHYLPPLPRKFWLHFIYREKTHFSTTLHEGKSRYLNYSSRAIVSNISQQS